jgi:integrase
VLNGMNVEKISTAVIENYKAKRLEEGAARQTVNNELGLIRRGLRLAFEQELLPRIPRVKNLRVQNAREGFVDPPDFLRIVKALETLDPPVADVVTFLYLLGWRREEVLGLTWEEVDAESGLLRLPARCQKRTPKTIRVGHEIHEVLRRRAALRNGPFVFHREGAKVRTFRGPWRRAVRAIGRPTLVVHDLRRSFARNALQAGLLIPLIL